MMLSPTATIMCEQLVGPAAASGHCCCTATPPAYPWLDQCFEKAEEELAHLEKLFFGDRAACPAGTQLQGGGGSSCGDFAPAAVATPPHSLLLPAAVPHSNVVRLQRVFFLWAP